MIAVKRKLIGDVNKLLQRGRNGSCAGMIGDRSETGRIGKMEIKLKSAGRGKMGVIFVAVHHLIRLTRKEVSK